MLVVDEQLTRSSVLCSTMNSETFYCPPWVYSVHSVEPRQTLHDELRAERRHRFTRAPCYPWVDPCSGDESIGDHGIELALAMVIEQIAQIAHLIQEDSDEFKRPSITAARFEELGDKAEKTSSVLVSPLAPAHGCGGETDVRKGESAFPGTMSGVSRRRSMVF